MKRVITKRDIFRFRLQSDNIGIFGNFEPSEKY